MSTKLLSETICRKGLMVKCFVALIVFCCSVGEAFAQTDTKVTINNETFTKYLYLIAAFRSVSIWTERKAADTHAASRESL